MKDSKNSQKTDVQKTDYDKMVELLKKFIDFMKPRPRRNSEPQQMPGYNDYEVNRTRMLMESHRVRFCTKCAADIGQIIGRRDMRYDAKDDGLHIKINCPYCKAKEYEVVVK